MESENDTIYATTEEATHALGAALVGSGGFLVDALPIRTNLNQMKEFPQNVLKVFVPTVKYIPEWFPGAGFKRFARLAKQNVNDSVDLPFQRVKESFQVRGLHWL